MVYGIAYCPISKIPLIESLGVADSKQLKESEREAILERILQSEDDMGWSTTVLSSNFISTSMLGRQNYNLNAMSHDSAIALLHRIIKGGVKVSVEVPIMIQILFFLRFVLYFGDYTEQRSISLCKISEICDQEIKFNACTIQT